MSVDHFEILGEITLFANLQFYSMEKFNYMQPKPSELKNDRFMLYNIDIWL
jgi:hypothetical protein